MFDWFKKPDYTNVVKFPAAVPYIEPPAPDPITYYSIGPTSNGRLNLKVGHNSITMNKAGVKRMIAMLETAHIGMAEDEDETE